MRTPHPAPPAVPTTPVVHPSACSVNCFRQVLRPPPKFRWGRRPHCGFRGLLRLHVRYGLRTRSTSFQRPLSPGFASTLTSQLPRRTATGVDRQFPGRDFHPLVACTFHGARRVGGRRGTGASEVSGCRPLRRCLDSQHPCPSPPRRSSNRACQFLAYGSRTDFTPEHATSRVVPTRPLRGADAPLRSRTVPCHSADGASVS